MHFLCVHESYERGGAEHSLRDLICSWPAPNHEWTVIVNATHPDPDIFRAAGATVLSLPDMAISDTEQNGEAALNAFRGILAKRHYDALILNNGGFPGGGWNYVAMQTPRTQIPRRIMIVRNVSPIRSLTAARRMCALHLDAVVTVTEDLANAIDPSTIWPCRTVRIYNGVPEPDQDQIGLSRDTPTLRCGVVGRLEERKGQALALGALDIVLARNLEVCLSFFGELDVSYSHLLCDHPLWHAPRVEHHFFGMDHDAIFGSLDVLLVPSLRQESCSRVVLEAAARSIPAIVSTCGGLPELVDSTTGWVVPINDETALAAAIEEAFEFASRIRRGDAARVRYIERHTATKMAIQYNSMLGTISQ